MTQTLKSDLYTDYTQSAMHTHEPQIPIVPLQLEDDGRSYRQTASQSHRSEIKSMEMIVSITSEPQQGWDNKFTLYRLPSERYRLYLLLLNSARCRKSGAMPASSGWAVRMFWQGRRAALGLVAMLHFFNKLCSGHYCGDTSTTQMCRRLKTISICLNQRFKKLQYAEEHLWTQQLLLLESEATNDVLLHHPMVGSDFTTWIHCALCQWVRLVVV